MATIPTSEAAAALRSLAEALDALGSEILGDSLVVRANVFIPSWSGITEARRIEIVTGANRLIGSESELRQGYFGSADPNASISFSTAAPDAWLDYLVAERDRLLAEQADAAFAEVQS